MSPGNNTIMCSKHFLQITNTIQDPTGAGAQQ